MRRVVITGMGIISCIGNGADEVEASLRAGKSGIATDPDMVKYGFRSQIAGEQIAIVFRCCSRMISNISTTVS